MFSDADEFKNTVIVRATCRSTIDIFSPPRGQQPNFTEQALRSAR